MDVIRFSVWDGFGMHSGRQERVVWRYMERKRWVALEQTMSLPYDTLLHSIFPIHLSCLYPVGPWHHIRILLRGWRYCYAVRWLSEVWIHRLSHWRSKLRAFPNPFHALSFSSFISLNLVSLDLWNFMWRRERIIFAWLLECKPASSFLVSKFRTVQNYLFWKFRLANPTNSRWWLMTDYNFFYPQEAISNHPTDSKKGVSRVSIKK